MKAVCPVCGNYGALENFLSQEDYKKALAVITGLPGNLPRLAVRYLALFRKPDSDRALTGPRVLKIVSGLRDLATARDIQWKGGRVHANRPEYWEQAISTMLERADAGKLLRPLDGHNYLRAIAYELADKEFEAGHREKEVQAATRTATAEPEPRAKGPARPDFRKQAENIQKMKDKLGMK